jgi:hypothetical protein
VSKGFYRPFKQSLRDISGLLDNPQTDRSFQGSGYTRKCPNYIGDPLGILPTMSPDVFIGCLKIISTSARQKIARQQETRPINRRVSAHIRYFLYFFSKHCGLIEITVIKDKRLIKEF